MQLFIMQNTLDALKCIPKIMANLTPFNSSSECGVELRNSIVNM